MKKEERRDTGQHKEENAIGSIPTTMRGLTLQMIDQRRENTAGRNLMMQKAMPGDATVTVCHSRSRDIKEHCLNADIIIAALGQPGFLTADMVKDGAVIIDVGTTRVPSTETKSGFRLKGDVDFENVAPKCSFITPVPGGVGPMTIVSLMKNTLLAARHDIYK